MCETGLNKLREYEKFNIIKLKVEHIMMNRDYFYIIYINSN
ncbi:hypothetical protein C672_0541 [[Clostridium] bifermentans ATCC 638]|uniref:Uncharacterized protein n=1 Tax=Paraclostridium bifermentans ATCC 638 = DSM 14991 TaxID=1233171 RepID=T4VL85_PARBF|nr:hypothetical protein C672_0541 [[Clostridium] bifermentans ATCC 638] [Paraclostridium bifermentans ATCC 638 = DSM 14991]